MRLWRRLPVRLSLTLWGTGVLGIALLALGIAVRVTVRFYLQTSIDNELTTRTVSFRQRLLRPPGPPGMPPDGGFGGGHPPGDGPGHPPHGFMGFGIGIAGRTPDLLAANLFRSGPDGRFDSPFGNGGRQRPADDPYMPRVYDRDGNPQRGGGPDSNQRPLDPAGIQSAVAQRKPVFNNVVYQDEHLRVCSYPVYSKTNILLGVVQIPLRLTDIERGLGAVDLTLLTLLPIALIVTVSGGVLLTSRAIRPIEQALEQERRFVADASHELRTPISIIRAAAELGLEPSEEDEPRPPRLIRALERIDVAAARTHRIVEDLMLLARAESASTATGAAPRSELTLTLEPVAAADLLHEAAALFEPIRGERTIMVEVVPGDLALSADRHHLGRVLSNLIDNAVRHTPAATGKIVLSARPAATGKVLLCVTDNGEGIPARDVPHLFRRFYRADASRARTRGGAGLGLSIARAVVEAHQGTIAIESAPGSGTTVRLTLPSAKKTISGTGV